MKAVPRGRSGAILPSDFSQVKAYLNSQLIYHSLVSLGYTKPTFNVHILRNFESASSRQVWRRCQSAAGAWRGGAGRGGARGRDLLVGLTGQTSAEPPVTVAAPTLNFALSVPPRQQVHCNETADD